MLPWFKADTDAVIDGMLDHEWSSPAPFYLAVIEWQAIVAAGRTDKWSHPRLAKRWQRPVCWVRKLKDIVASQANRRQIADASQGDSRLIAGSSQDDSRSVAGKSQGQPSGGRTSGDFDSRAIADRSQDNSRLIAGSSQDDSRDNAASRAPAILDPKILDLEIQIESVDRDGEKKKDPPLPPVGGDAVVDQKPQLSLVDLSSDHDPTPVSKRRSPSKSPTGLPGVLSSLEGRQDAQMWKAIWEGLKASHKPVVLEIVQVWDAYRQVFPDRKVLDKQGAGKIADALLLGYSVEDLALVPVGASKSEFHMGKNEHGKRYLDVVTLFRDSKAIDDHIRRCKGLDSETRGKVPTQTRNAFGGRQEGIDWDSEFGPKRR